MANLTRTVEVKVIAEYWARIELDESELDKTEAELEEMAWREFYDTAHRATIEETSIESDLTSCWECEEDDVDSDHECEDEPNEDDEEEEEEEE